MAQKDFLDSVLRQAAERNINNNITSYLDFFEPVTQKFCEHEIARYPGSDIKFFGGHLYCERKMACVIAKGQEEIFDEYPIDVIHIKKSSEQIVLHKDVLGSLIALGIQRDKIGDINISDNLIQIFISSPLGDFICNELSSISKYSFSAVKVSLKNVIVFEPNFIQLSIIIPSMRLDVLIHSVYKLSRNEASDFVKGEKVYINHAACTKPSVNLKKGDIISVRTKGRFIVDDIIGSTKKGNIRLNVRKFD